jgi:ribose transport system ATP-binding protein
MAEDVIDTGGGGSPPPLELIGVSKSFGGVAALRDVSFTLEAGEIHGLVGENGAGKSTLMKIIAGVHTEFEGVMKIDGKEVRLSSARDALHHSIGMVHQELSIVADLSVAENVFLGSQPVTAARTIDWRRMNREAKKLLASLGLNIDPTTRMGAHCSRAPASSFSTSRPRPCRRPRLRVSSGCCANCAPRATALFSYRTFSMT